MARVLVDTNVLVYAHDPADPAKQQRAIAVLDGLQGRGTACLSAQCLAEFYRTCVRQLPSPLLPADGAARQVALLARSYGVLPVTSMVVLEAVRGAQQHQLSSWDAQIWAVARLNQVPVVFTEDFPAALVIEGVRFVNPLVDASAVEAYG